MLERRCRCVVREVDVVSIERGEDGVGPVRVHDEDEIDVPCRASDSPPGCRHRPDDHVSHPGDLQRPGHGEEASSEVDHGSYSGSSGHAARTSSSP